MNNLLRQILVLTVLATAGCDQSTSETHVDEAPIMTSLDMIELTASEAVIALKSGEMSVQKYMEALVEQTAAHSDSLNAFITHEPSMVIEAAKALDEKRQRAESLGPLFGIPISLKDLISTKDLATTFGTNHFANFTPSKNAEIVDRLIAADAIIFGKNNAQEWAFGSTGYNSHYGQQLNPYDKSRIAGGSSGGGVAAVAARMLPIAIGSDTAASIRVPAAYTGLYGLRPSTGRYSTEGVAPLAPTLDTLGPLTRSVDDMTLIDSVLSDDYSPLPEVKLNGLRLGVPKAFFHQGVSSEMIRHFNQLLDQLAAAGVSLVGADITEAQSLTDSGLYPILFHETYPSIVSFLEEWGDGTSIDELHQALGPDIKGMWDQLVMPGAPQAIPENVYRDAIENVRPKMQAAYKAYFDNNKVSAIIFPATASAAPLAKPDNPQETIIDGEVVSIFINDHNSSPGALAGQPGVVLPMSMSATGLPLAFSLDGKRNQDRELLAISKALASVIKPLPAPTLGD